MTPAQINQIAERLFDLDMVIDEIIWLGAASARPSDRLRELVESDPEDVLKVLGLKIEDDADYDDDALVLDMIQDCRKLGFLVKIASPVREFSKPADPESSSMSSWGHYHTGWLYVETLGPELADLMEKWQHERDQKSRDRQIKEATNATDGNPETPN